MALQDIVVITSTAIAVMLTKNEPIHSANRQPVASLDANVIALRPSACSISPSDGQGRALAFVLAEE